MSALNHRRLQQFIAVAEAGSFRAAAQALNMSQPPLSKSIQQLEAELGATLFERFSSGIRLTPAGETLLKDGQEIQRHLKRAERSVRTSVPTAAPLEIGFVSAALSVAVPTVLRQMETANLPRPRLVELTTPEQVELLSTGRLDLGFLHPPVALPVSLESRTIAREPLLLALPDAHPLCRNKRITTADLSGERLVMFPEQQGPALYNKLRETLTTDGQLNVAAEATRIHSQLALVSSGLGIGFIGAFTADKLSYRGVQIRIWSDRPSDLEMTLAIAGRGEMLDRYVACFQSP